VPVVCGAAGGELLSMPLFETCAVLTMAFLLTWLSAFSNKLSGKNYSKIFEICC
jgi:hypothetical protein